MIDSQFQTVIFGLAVNSCGAAMAFYFWTENRSERYLLYWATAWSLGVVRWAIHIPAASSPPLLDVEVSLISVMMVFVVLSSYEVLPHRPLRVRTVAIGTSVVLAAYTVAVTRSSLSIEMSYAMFATSLALAGFCFSAAWRAQRLSGYAFAAGTFFAEFLLIATLVAGLGRGVSDTIIVPLYNLPLILSIAVIAHQRGRRRLAESEGTLQKIFDTAPAPIVIVKPPGFEIERANAAAFEMLGVSPGNAIGKSALEQGLVVDAERRKAVFAEVLSGKHVRGREMFLKRGGSEQRLVSVNADLIALESGNRVIYSFFDLTDLRRAEEELRQSAEEIRALYVRLATAEDDERRALHLELHDRVGSNLTALRLELDMAERHLAAGNVTSVQRHVESARAVAADTMVMARNLMAELRPPALDDFGLVAALGTFADGIARRLDIPVDIDGDELDPRPGLLVEGTLFRIAQEAVVNATRHASAGSITVSVAQHQRSITLTVEDDGVGFDPSAEPIGGDHWGLRNMRERARAIGGTLAIESKPGEGTRIIAEVPRRVE